MAIAKLILNSVTQMDVTGTTAVVSDVASGKKYIKADGTEGIGTASFGPAVTIESLSVASNGTYTASSGYAFSPVTVSVPEPSGTSNITSNGTYDVASYASAFVNVSGGGGDDNFEKMIDKTITSVSANTSIVGDYAFASCNNLSTANFPSATVIQQNAFYSCSSLSSISFPNAISIMSSAFAYTAISSFTFPSLKTVSWYAFYNCKSITEITSTTFPELKEIGSYCFTNCTSLSYASFPKVEVVYSNAFSSCSNLTSVRFPELTLLSGGSAFGYCSKLSDVFFPKLKSVANYTFNSCIALTELTDSMFPELLSVSTSGFYQCRGLQSVHLTKLTSLYSGAFAGCSVLSSLSIPNIRYLGYSVFSYCSLLTSVSFPDVVSVGTGLFSNCYNLNTALFVLISSMAGSMFQNCYNLLSLYLLSDSVVGFSNAFANTPISNRTTSTGGVYGSIYVPSSLYASYISATGWSAYSSRFVSYSEPTTGPYVSMHSRPVFRSGSTGIWNAGWMRTPVVGQTYHITLSAERAYRDRLYSFDDNVEWGGFPYTLTPSVSGTPAGTETFSITKSGITHQISTDEELTFDVTFSFEDI